MEELAFGQRVYERTPAYVEAAGLTLGVVFKMPCFARKTVTVERPVGIECHSADLMTDTALDAVKLDQRIYGINDLTLLVSYILSKDSSAESVS